MQFARIPEPLLIKGALLWDGVNEKVMNRPAVLVEKGLITAVGPFDDLSTRTDSVLDWSPSTLMPGLIDSHTHLSMDPTIDNYLSHMSDDLPELTLRAVAMMKKDLLSGVTTCRCLGDRGFLDVAIKKAVLSDQLEGPCLKIATRGIRAPGGHGFVGYPFDGVDQIRNAIRENIQAGADLIKIYITGTLKGTGQLPSYLKYDEIKSAIEEANRSGLSVAAHCVGGQGLDWALELGLDTLEHAYHITDEQIDRLGRSRTSPVLTPSPILTRARVLHLPASLVQGHLDEKEEIFNRMSALVRSGLTFGVGTDGMHGDLAREIAYLVELGATIPAALKAATIHGAAICGVGQKTGSLEAGKSADIIAVRGNPLDDLGALWNVDGIMKEGRLIKSNSEITRGKN